MNYFQLFNLPATLDIDKQQLSHAYQTLQKLTHPDKFASGTDQEKRIALQKNAQLNDAYSVLKHPLSRAQNLLALRGIEINGEQQTMQDNSFLMQQMEWREALDDVRGDEDALERFSDELISDINARIAHLSALFSDSEQASIASHNEVIAHEIRKLTFIYKFQSQVEQYLEQLEE